MSQGVHAVQHEVEHKIKHDEEHGHGGGGGDHGHAGIDTSTINKRVALLIAVIALFLAFSETLGKSAQTSALNHQIEASKLAEIVRRVDVVAALRRPVSMQEAESVLLAARDRDGEKEK